MKELVCGKNESQFEELKCCVGLQDKCLMKCRRDLNAGVLLVLAQLLPELLGEEAAGVHAQIDGGREGDEEGHVGHARDVLHADLHRRLALLSLAVDGGTHHEAGGSAGHVGGDVDAELAALAGADRGIGDGHVGASGVRHELEAVSECAAVGGPALAPGFEAAPRLPVCGDGVCGAGGPDGAADGAEDEPGPRVGARDAVGARGGHEGRHHRRCSHRRSGEVMDRHRPPLALLPPPLMIPLAAGEPASDAVAARDI